MLTGGHPGCGAGLPWPIDRRVTGEDELFERMATLARQLRSQPTHDSTLRHIVDAAQELVEGCDSAGISVATTKGQVKTAVCTSDLVRDADELQQQLVKGPAWTRPGGNGWCRALTLLPSRVGRRGVPRLSSGSGCAAWCASNCSPTRTASAR